MMSVLITIAAGVGFLGFMWNRMAERWQYLATHYGRSWQGPQAFKLLQNGIIRSQGGLSQSYSGILSIGVFANGIGLKLVPPFSAFHTPLFIPFNEIKAWDQKWYINSDSVELDFPSAPEVKIILPKDQVDWIYRQSHGGFELPAGASPHQTDIALWKAFAGFYLGMTILFVLLYGGRWALGLPIGL